MKQTVASAFLSLIFVSSSIAQSILTRPNAGDKLLAGNITTIAWDASSIKAPISILLWDGQRGEWSTVCSNLPASAGEFKWLIPNKLGDRFRLKLVQEGATGAQELTRSFFSIVQPQVASVKSMTLHSSLPEIRVHPNPITDHALICLDEIPAGEKFHAEVIDAKGGHVATIYDAVPEADLGICYRLDCSQLAAGTYLVRVANGWTGKTMKFVKE